MAGKSSRKPLKVSLGVPTLDSYRNWTVKAFQPQTWSRSSARRLSASISFCLASPNSYKSMIKLVNRLNEKNHLFKAIDSLNMFGLFAFQIIDKLNLLTVFLVIGFTFFRDLFLYTIGLHRKISNVTHSYENSLHSKPQIYSLCSIRIRSRT